MDSAMRIQQQSKLNRIRLNTGIAATAVLTLLLFFVVGSNAPNMAVAMGILTPLVIACFACARFLGLRIVGNMERDSFDEGMHVVMEGVPMVCSLHDKDNNIQYCNDKAPKLFGFRDRQEYCREYSSTFPEFQPEGGSSKDMSIKFIDEVIKDGSATIDWFQKTRSGDLIPLQLTSVRTYFQGENHMLEFTTDKRRELEIQKQGTAIKERIQAVLDASPLVCAIYDEQGNAMDVNKEVENLFDIPNKQIFLTNPQSFFPERQPDGTNSIQKNMDVVRQAQRDGHCRNEFVYRRKDGTPLPTEEIASYITAGGETFFIVYTRDLRKEYAAREMEQAAQKKLQTMTDRLNGQLETQSSAITESSAAIEQMVANTRSVNNTLSKNAQNVKELQEAAAVGQSGLNEVATDFKEIARESESLLEINAVMQSIASQTNLLSMNAAIEAAHAGESGRGFAVVADEIRKLAESSSRQSKTIGGVLKKIKSSIDKITKSTENVMNKFEAIDGGIKTVAEQENGILNAMGNGGTERGKRADHAGDSAGERHNRAGEGGRAADGRGGGEAGGLGNR